MNINGQLGDGTYNDRLKPVAVKNLRGIQTIDSGNGSAHSEALKNDGTVVAWGENYTGQLGDATTTDRTTPVQVSGLSGVKAISVGYVHNLALKGDGKVAVWGQGDYGQLGDGSTVDRHAPILLNTVGNVKAIAAGGSHSLAMVSDPVLAQ